MRENVNLVAQIMSVGGSAGFTPIMNLTINEKLQTIENSCES